MDTSVKKKINYSLYIVKQLYDWCLELGMSKEQAIEKLDKITVLKMIFFIAGVSGHPTKDDTKDYGLLEIFDHFLAMPYGPVEKDIFEKYEIISKFINENLDNKQELSEEGVEGNYIDLINKGINTIRKYNNKLISYRSFKLVDITHKWSCWRNVFYNSSNNNTRIPTDEILYSTKWLD